MGDNTNRLSETDDNRSLADLTECLDLHAARLGVPWPDGKNWLEARRVLLRALLERSDSDPSVRPIVLAVYFSAKAAAAKVPCDGLRRIFVGSWVAMVEGEVRPHVERRDHFERLLSAHADRSGDVLRAILQSKTSVLVPRGEAAAFFGLNSPSAVNAWMRKPLYRDCRVGRRYDLARLIEARRRELGREPDMYPDVLSRGTLDRLGLPKNTISDQGECVLDLDADKLRVLGGGKKKAKIELPGTIKRAR